MLVSLNPPINCNGIVKYEHCKSLQVIGHLKHICLRTLVHMAVIQAFLDNSFGLK